jgi:hypothetical protein
MIWELLSDEQKQEVKDFVNLNGLEFQEVYAQVGENTLDPMVFDPEMRLVDIQGVIEEIYLRDLTNG